jgi:hypothetical protein
MIILAEISTGMIDGVVLHLYGSVVCGAAVMAAPETVRGRWVVGWLYMYHTTAARYAAGTAKQPRMAATDLCGRAAM